MSDNQKPTLIYDGDCGFCIYWVNYWKKLTNNDVNYQPYQSVSDEYPEIPIESFQHAVQYVTPDRKIKSAAEASFLTLSHAKSHRFWLTLYYWLPGFAFLSEKAYNLISSHRECSFRICRLLWGRELNIPSYTLVSWLFLRLLGIIYLAAFISFGSQALGLIGSGGILPVNNLIKAATLLLGTERYWQLPMIFWLNSSNVMIQAVCWIGIVSSILLIFNFSSRLNLLLLYLLYLSLIYAGQAFMTYQWDVLLIETGTIALLMTFSTTAGIWLLRWLQFRFIFASGLVKIFSGDIAWRNFTALYYHFYTQPLPTPLAWYADKLPATLLKTLTLGTLVIELIMPFLIFMPRRLRFLAAVSILCLQFGILVTGNYNWFNLLAILLCLPLFDDAALLKLVPAFNKIKTLSAAIPHKWLTISFVYLFTITTVSISFVQLAILMGANPPNSLVTAATQLSPLRLTNSYGPFAVMTKAREEIIIEGSQDGIEWKPYLFKYKPDKLAQRPRWNIPFQPRLDWQMWFAALSTANQTPWFLSFVQQLLLNSPDVLALLKYNPFPDTPPVYIRALVYDYHFTTFKEKRETGNWWKRELVWSYLQPVNLQHPPSPA